MYAILAQMDDQNHPTRYNWVETELEAQQIVSRLTGQPVPDGERADIEARLAAHADSDNPLHLSDPECVHCENRLKPLKAEKQTPDAFYVEMPAAPVGSVGYEHQAAFWVADPVAKTVSFDGGACVDEQEKRRWEQEMMVANKAMSDDMEEVWDAVGTDNATQKVKDAYDAKKEVRARKP